MMEEDYNLYSPTHGWRASVIAIDDSPRAMSIDYKGPVMKSMEECKYTLHPDIKQILGTNFNSIELCHNENAADYIWDYLQEGDNMTDNRLWQIISSNANVDKIIAKDPERILADDRIDWNNICTSIKSTVLIKILSRHWDILDKLDKLDQLVISNITEIYNAKSIVPLILAHKEWFAKHNLIFVGQLIQYDEAYHTLVIDPQGKWRILFETAPNLYITMCGQRNIAHFIELHKIGDTYTAPFELLNYYQIASEENSLAIKKEFRDKLHIWREIIKNPWATSVIERIWSEVERTVHLVFKDLLKNQRAGYLIARLWDRVFAPTATIDDYDLICELCANESAITLLDDHWDWFINAPVPNDAGVLVILPGQANATQQAKKNTHLQNLFRNRSAIGLLEKHWDWIEPALTSSGTNNVLTIILFNNKYALKLMDKFIQNTIKIVTTIPMYIIFGNIIYSIHASQILDKYWDILMSNNEQSFNFYYALAALFSKNDVVPLIIKQQQWFIEHMGQLVSIIKLHYNPGIFIDEYEPVCRAWFRDEVAAELMAHVWHPRNISRFASLGVDPDV